MKEQLITFETAKLAKEKGFDIPTPFYYHPHYGLYASSFEYGDEAEVNDNYNSDEWADGYYAAPTQSLLQKWLREKYNIEVELRRHFKSYNIMRICTYIKDEDINTDKDLKGLDFKDFKTYEQALETGLLTALNTIQNDQHNN